MKNIVVFASGSGTNFQALIDAVEAGKIDARISGLISSRPGTKALKRADDHHIRTRVLAPSSFESQAEYERELLQTMQKWSADLIVLAGYLLKIPDSFIEQFRNRIVNIHPSLLPKYGGKGFYGMKVHEAVIANRDRKTGCTVHYVTEEYDQGPIIRQVEVPVYETDDPESLAARVLKQEHRLLPQVVGELVEELEKE